MQLRILHGEPIAIGLKVDGKYALSQLIIIMLDKISIKNVEKNVKNEIEYSKTRRAIF